MVTEIVEKVMRNGIVSFAEKAGVRVAHSQLLIFCKEETAIPCYKSVIYNQPSREVSFNEILGVKIDLLNREAISAPFIQNSLLRYAEEFSVPVTHVFIAVYVDEYNKKVGLFLYDGSKPLRGITLDEVLSQPKVV